MFPDVLSSPSGVSFQASPAAVMVECSLEVSPVSPTVVDGVCTRYDLACC